MAHEPAAIPPSQPAAPNDPAAWGYAARSPMTGKIWRTTPASRADTSAARPRFSVPIARRIRLGSALNLFHSAQTKPCLGHCITRGLGLRRQATILRLRGAVLFSRPKAGPAREFGRARGVETHTARGSALPTRGQMYFASRWNMELCGSAPVTAEECGRFP